MSDHSAPRLARAPPAPRCLPSRPPTPLAGRPSHASCHGALAPSTSTSPKPSLHFSQLSLHLLLLLVQGQSRPFLQSFNFSAYLRHSERGARGDEPPCPALRLRARSRAALSAMHPQISRKWSWVSNLRLSQGLELLAKARGAHAIERASLLPGHGHHFVVSCGPLFAPHFLLAPVARSCSGASWAQRARARSARLQPAQGAQREGTAARARARVRSLGAHAPPGCLRAFLAPRSACVAPPP